MPNATSSPLPAVVTIQDLPSYSSPLSGSELVEAVQTVGGVAISVQVPLTAIMTTILGGLPTGGGTGQILNKTNANNYSTQWSSITQFVGVGTGLVTSGSATSIVAAFATQSALSVLGVAGNATLEPAAIVGIAAQVLRVNDAGNALAFGAVNLASSAAVTGVLPSANITAVNLASSGAGGVQGVLPVANGGQGTSTLTAKGVLFGNTISAVGITAAGNTSIPLLGGGPGNNPAFGVLPVIGGGTNTTILTANAVLYGAGTSTIGLTSAATTGTVLAANAGTADFTGSPQINTSVTVPIVIGGTLTTSNLALQAGTTGTILLQLGGTTYASLSTASFTVTPLANFNNNVAISTTGANQLSVNNPSGQYSVVSYFHGGLQKVQTYYDFTNNIFAFNSVTTAPIDFLPNNVQSLRLTTTGGINIGGLTDPGAGNLTGIGTATFIATKAIPTVGTAAVLFSSTAGFGIYCGTGVPSVSAATGSLYLRIDGTTNTSRMYVNINGTTWTAVNTVA